jgi:surfeit locus 1 family protein
LPVLVALLALGMWQVERLAWKEQLLSEIADRTTRAPVPLAQLLAATPSPDALEYTPVQVSGRFNHDSEMFFFATHEGQSGWYVYTPLSLSSPRAPYSAIIVNRGFVPFDQRDAVTRPGSQPDGEVTITGLARARLSSPPSWLVPDNKPQQREFFWKDWRTMVSISGLSFEATVPFFVDASAEPNAGGLPVGGVTLVNLPNNHLQYAVTWFGLAATLMVIVGVMVLRRMRGA